MSFDGEDWWPATDWGVVVNNGTGACVNSTNYELLMTHELGHGLGFGHPASSGHLMSATCCNNFSSLDTACAEYLYPVAGPTNTPTPIVYPDPHLDPRRADQHPDADLHFVMDTDVDTDPDSDLDAGRTDRDPDADSDRPTDTPGGPTNTPTPTPTKTPTSAAPSPTPTTGPSKVTVPVVVHSEGVGGTSWRSDLMVSNRNGGSQTVRLTYQTAAKAAFSKESHPRGLRDPAPRRPCRQLLPGRRRSRPGRCGGSEWRNEGACGGFPGLLGELLRKPGLRAAGRRPTVDRGSVSAGPPPRR